MFSEPTRRNRTRAAQAISAGQPPASVASEATLVLVPACGGVDDQNESVRDTVILIIAGDGTCQTDRSPQNLRPGILLWMPEGSVCCFVAGASGLAYLAVSPRRDSGRRWPRSRLRPLQSPSSATSPKCIAVGGGTR